MCVRGIRLMPEVDAQGPQSECIEHTDAQLRQEREELRRIVDLIPVTVIVLNANGNAIYANRVALEYTGLSLDEVRADDFRDRVFHPEDVQRLRQERQKGLSGTIPFEIEQRALRSDGQYRWFLIRYNPFRDEQGQVVRWYATGTDIEDRKQVEEKLRQVIDTIPTIAWCNLPDGPNEYLNKRWREYAGLSSEESHGWGWQAALHPEDLPPLMEKWREMLASGEAGAIEARMRRHDGVFRWFLIRAEPLRNESGKIVRWYGTSTDIEDRRQAEEKLGQDERELRQLIDFLPEHVLVLDQKGSLLQANKTMLDYLGYTLEEMISGGDQQRMSRDVHPDDLERTQAERRASLAKGVPFEMDKRLRRKDGQFRWFLFRYRPVLDGDGQVVRWFVVATDIEDRKNAEERMRNETVALREDIVRSSMFEEIVGSSKALREILAQISRVAPTGSTVLIQGETGTGKELIARAIHNRSRRVNRAFIRVNCAAIPPSLIASELFGHEKGAFTGALQRRIGRFESADGGTIFLDEVGELPQETQISLLRVLQEREFERIGGNQSIHIDVRVLAATNRDLSAAVEEGSFRKDLFYRLNVFPIHVPPLRDRGDDIPLLVRYLVDRYAQQAGKPIRSIDRGTLRLLQSYNWPGNVRELQNVIERAVILCDDETFRVDESWFMQTAPVSKSKRPFAADLAEREKAMIENALRETKGLISGPSGAAVKLGLPRQTLESKIRKLGINRYRFKAT